MSKNRLIYKLITSLYMAGIMYVSLLPDTKHHTDNLRQILNNFLHIPVYGLLAYLVLDCFSSSKFRAYVVSFIIAILFGIINEVVQAFVPGRTASISDAFLNGIGSIVALGIIYFLKSRHTRIIAYY